MRKLHAIAFGLMMVCQSVSSQEIIRNPARPQNSAAGRILRLEPVFEIRDDTGEFFFKYPYKFDIDPKGFFYVLDKDELLKFSPEGTFIGNLYKKGQGPGEISKPFQMVSFCARDDGLFIYDGATKIIRLDHAGVLVDEVRQTAGAFFELFGVTDRGFLMRGQTDLPWGGGAGFKVIETTANLVSRDGRSFEKIVSFPSRVYQGPGFGMDWDNYLQTYDKRDGSLYVSHTCEYKVVRAYLDKRAPAASFNREYPRTAFVLSEEERDFYQRFNPPKKDYANDVVALFAGGDGLWVQTSTAVKGKGVLFDVFDPQGRFRDSFYLPEPMDLVAITGPFIFVKEKDPEENLILKKYRVLNGPGAHR